MEVVRKRASRSNTGGVRLGETGDQDDPGDRGKHSPSLELEACGWQTV